MKLCSWVLSFSLFASVAAAEYQNLFGFGSEPVDYLNHGLRTLEFDLRLKSLELCLQANCRDVEVKHGVSFTASRPSLFPADLQWPDGGAIIIAVAESRFGSDSSFATDGGCRTRLASLRSLSKWPDPRLSYARFFLPEVEWRAVRSLNEENATARRMRAIAARMFFVVTESHEWRKSSGEVDRAVWVSCAGSLTGDDMAIISRKQYPQ